MEARPVPAELSATVPPPEPLEDTVSVLRAALESSADGILVIGLDGAFKTYNQKFLQMWGLPESKMREPRGAVPCMTEQLIDPEGFIARVRALYATPEAESLDMLALKDGRVFERYSLPYRMGDTVVGRVWSYRDVTQRELQVAERDRLQQEKLEALEQADVLKNQFLSILSHELRTPINAITGFGSMMQDELAGPLNERQQHFMGRILHGSDILLALVNDLLDMSRIQAGKLSLTPGRVDLGPQLADAVAQLRPMAERKGLSLAFEAIAPLPEITADALRIRQVITNLVANAIKFTQQGAVTVRVSVQNGGFRCDVVDTGIGVAAEHHSRLFSPFTQVDMTATRAAGGTGLGLSISRSIVEAHGGAIGFESTPGQGSTFWFTLPLDAS
jgi:PAS domain S-box-containing protein